MGIWRAISERKAAIFWIVAMIGGVALMIWGDWLPFLQVVKAA